MSCVSIVVLLKMSATTAESLLETLKKKLLAFKINVKTLTMELERKQALLKDEKEKREKVGQIFLIVS